MDSRGVDLPMTYDLTFDMLLSLKPLFFNSLKISHDSQTTLKHKTLESNKSVAEIPPHAAQDDLTSKVTPFEERGLVHARSPVA